MSWRRKHKTFWEATTKPPRPHPRAAPYHAAQQAIRGWNQEALARARALVVGLGTGSHVAQGLARVGVGALTLADPDEVLPSNLNRAAFDYRDIGKPKALATLDHIQRIATARTHVRAYRLWFSDLGAELRDHPPTVACVFPDNDLARRQAASFCLDRGIPLVSAGLQQGGSGFQVLVQTPAQPGCIACALPESSGPAPCVQNGADCALAAEAAGVTLRAILDLVMGRPLGWSSRVVISGLGQCITGLLPSRASCSICHGRTPS